MRGWENVKVLPERILRMLTPAQRKELGAGGRLAEEVIAKATAKAEKELQRQVLTLLQEHRGIVVLYNRMDRKHTGVVGTPDLIFSVVGSPANGNPEAVFPCAWECKIEDEELSAAQEEMKKKMLTWPNFWRHRVIRSMEEARRELAEMGVGGPGEK